MRNVTEDAHLLSVQTYVNTPASFNGIIPNIAWTNIVKRDVNIFAFEDLYQRLHCKEERILMDHDGKIVFKANFCPHQHDFGVLAVLAIHLAKSTVIFAR